MPEQWNGSLDEIDEASTPEGQVYVTVEFDQWTRMSADVNAARNTALAALCVGAWAMVSTVGILLTLAVLK